MCNFKYYLLLQGVIIIYCCYNNIQYTAKTFTEFIPNNQKKETNTISQINNNINNNAHIQSQNNAIHTNNSYFQSQINELKNELSEEKNKNKILINENKKLNEKINNLNIEIRELENKIKSLENNISIKNIEKQNLTSKNNLNNENIITKIKEGEKIISVNFVSMGTNDIGHFSLVCKNIELFVRLEERLYSNYPQFKDYETYFEVNGKRIKRFKTLEQNNIKTNDIINIFTIDI